MLRCLAWLAALTLSGCSGRSAPSPEGPAFGGEPDPKTRSAPPYLAVQAEPREAYPEAGIRGLFRIVDGCALLDEELLIFPHGTTLAPGGDAVFFSGNRKRRFATA